MNAPSESARRRQVSDDHEASSLLAIELHPSNIAAGSIAEGLMNLGTIELGRVGLEGLSGHFEVRNLAGVRLEDVRLIPTCGCTEVSPSRESLAAGETLSVRFRLAPRVAGEQLTEINVVATPLEGMQEGAASPVQSAGRPVERMRIAWNGAPRFRLAVDSIAVDSWNGGRFSADAVERAIGRSSSQSGIHESIARCLGGVPSATAAHCIPAARCQ